MHVAVEEGTRLADSFLSERTRDVFHWYAKGCLSAREALLLIGDACLRRAELAGRENDRPRARVDRDAV